MKPPIIRLGTRHKRLLYLLLVLLWGSGALWLLFHYFLQVDGDFGPAPHVLEKWWLRLHGLSMMLFLIALGSLLVQHAPLAWNRHKNRASGAGLLFYWTWLLATGYALYYFSSDTNAAWLPLVHWLPGLLAPLLLAGHLWLGRKRPRAAHHATTRLHHRPPYGG
jgi:hypothetical protein